MKNRRQQGFTIIELMIVVGIIAVLAAFALPSYRYIVERQKVRSALMEWESAFYLARSEAMRLKDSITFCSSSDGVVCSGSRQFNQGWIVVRNLDREGSEILLDNGFDDNTVNISINSRQFANGRIEFLGNGRIRNAVAATLTVGIMRDGNANDDSCELVNGKYKGTHNTTRCLSINSGGRLIGVKR